MHSIDIQYALDRGNLPNVEQFTQWVDISLGKCCQDAEVVIRIVDEQESANLNQQFRKCTGPTNVLSFPYSLPEIVGLNLLGDLIFCAPVIEKEAKEQHKQLFDHWAHMVVHGILHLLGHNHTNDTEAVEMETLEFEILNQLKISNPYEDRAT